MFPSKLMSVVFFDEEELATSLDKDILHLLRKGKLGYNVRGDSDEAAEVYLNAIDVTEVAARATSNRTEENCLGYAFM